MAYDFPAPRVHDGGVHVLTFRGKTYGFRRAEIGEVYFEVCYSSDPAAAYRNCAAAAAANGRKKAYPVHIWPNVLAIKETLILPEDTTLDQTTIFSWYDSDPALFDKLAGAAFEALGISESLAVYSGLTAWNQVFVAMREAEKAAAEGEEGWDEKVRAAISAARKVSAEALNELRGAPVDESEGDPVMEGFLDTQGPEGSQGPGSE